MALSDAQGQKWAEIALKLRLLTGGEDWDAYLVQMALLEQELIEKLIEAPSNEHDLFRGAIQGMRKALSIPDIINARVQQARNVPNKP